MRKFLIALAVSLPVALVSYTHATGEFLLEESDQEIAMFEPRKIHPMNDSWMGMTVKTHHGKIIGVIVDAPIGDEGRLNSIVIDTSDSPLEYLGGELAVKPKLIELHQTHAEIADWEFLIDLTS